MDVLHELRKLEEIVASAEIALLDKDIQRTHDIIKSLLGNPLSEYIPMDEVLERLNDSELTNHDALFPIWDESKEGYRSPRNEEWRHMRFGWYDELSGTRVEKGGRYIDYVDRVLSVYEARSDFTIITHPFEGLRELYALSKLRYRMRRLWERFVADIILSQYKTPLEQVARHLSLKLSEVIGIAKLYADEHQGTIDRKEMVFLCKEPDYDIVPIVNLPEPPEAKVIYLIICPNCRHRNEQGRTTCEHCNAPL